MKEVSSDNDLLCKLKSNFLFVNIFTEAEHGIK